MGRVWGRNRLYSKLCQHACWVLGVECLSWATGHGLPVPGHSGHHHTHLTAWLMPCVLSFWVPLQVAELFATVFAPPELNMVDASGGLADLLSCKDTAEVLNVKKAAMLASKVREREGGRRGLCRALLR